jgi:hypothetical protein
VRVSPWPFVQPELHVLLVGFEGNGYPARLRRTLEPIAIAQSFSS